MKTISEINERIKRGDAVVVRADEMPEIFEEDPKRAVREVDVVTTGTFGVMCSSGAFLNFGHSDPPIKMQKVWLNEVRAYSGIAAVDAYIGATQSSYDRGIDYGGGHVITDLVCGKEIELKASSLGTDCYPRKRVETSFTIDDLNQAVMCNPRNGYARYNAAVNSTNSILYTYMGTLLPTMRNINFAGTGEISPLANDPDLEAIGVGTNIFLCGAQGIITGEGTQSSPSTGFPNISTQADMREMCPEFLAGASIPGYGNSLFVGLGVPIPILNEKIAEKTAVRNRDIKTNLLDYGILRRDRPVVKEVTYEELFSGKVDVNGKSIRCTSLSSMEKSFKIMDTLKEWITDKEFYLSSPIKPLPKKSFVKPMKLNISVPLVCEVMTKNVIVAKPHDSIEDVSRIVVEKEIDQIPIIDRDGKLIGIVTSWDITKAVAQKTKQLDEIMSRNLITCRDDEYVDAVTRRFERFKINATPVVDQDNRLIGIITMSDIIRNSVRKKNCKKN